MWFVFFFSTILKQCSVGSVLSCAKLQLRRKMFFWINLYFVKWKIEFMILFLPFFCFVHSLLFLITSCIKLCIAMEIVYVRRWKISRCVDLMDQGKKSRTGKCFNQRKSDIKVFHKKNIYNFHWRSNFASHRQPLLKMIR